MSSNRHVLKVIGGAVVALAIGGAFLVWPSYREWRATNREIATLEVKMAALPEMTREVEGLASRVTEARRKVELELKIIPVAPDMASLMRKLSLPVDKLTVHDQTVTAGTVAEAIIGDKESTVMVLPFTVEMQASFDAVYATLRVAESMNRLVRVSSVRMECKRDTETNPPLLTASVGLEAVFDAGAPPEER